MLSRWYVSYTSSSFSLKRSQLLGSARAGARWCSRKCRATKDGVAGRSFCTDELHKAMKLYTARFAAREVARAHPARRSTGLFLSVEAACAQALPWACRKRGFRRCARSPVATRFFWWQASGSAEAAEASSVSTGILLMRAGARWHPLAQAPKNLVAIGNLAQQARIRLRKRGPQQVRRTVVAMRLQRHGCNN